MLLEVKNLSVIHKGISLIEDISFELEHGKSIGIVGQSGSGKTTLIQAIASISDKKVNGSILFESKPICRKDLGKNIGMIFQDPLTYLNPTLKIVDQITESLIYHKMLSKKEAKLKAIELLELVGIDHPLIRLEQYPHELSGGMRQRILIAIAVACKPKLLIADEPTSALDVILQAQILKLIYEMKKEANMGLILVSHDLDLVCKYCDFILVMQNGKIVQKADVKDYKNPIEILKNLINIQRGVLC